jgi:hypothetical protein
MTQTPLLDAFVSIRLDTLEVGEGAIEREPLGPILVADGHIHAISNLDHEIHATRAYAARLRGADLERVSRFLRADALVLDATQVEDLSELARMEQLQWLQISWNTKVATLDPLARLTGLTRLSIDDTPKVRDLQPIEALRNLVAFDYSGGIWNKNTAASLEPIARLPSLEELRLNNIKVLDGGLRPLAASRTLRRLDVSNQFETSDYAFLSVALPDVECDMFAPYVELQAAIGGRGVMVVGRRKGILNADRDATRLARHVAEFEALQAGFRAELAAIAAPSDQPAAD